MSSQSLLGNAPSSWSTKVAVGTVVGACLASVLLTSASTSSLYAAPAAPAVAQATSVVAPVGMVGKQGFPMSSAVAAAPIGTDFELDMPANAAQSTSWTPLAAVAAFPLAILGAVAFFRSSKKAVVLDPIDLLQSSGTQWSMVASAGQHAIAKNYAAALIELGQEGQNLEQLHSDMDNFGALLADEAFAAFINNPLLGGDKLKEVIASICDESQMSPVTKDFLSFLVDKKRITQLSAIIKEFDAQFYDVTGTQVATVTAAVAMGEDQLRQIANKLHEMTKGKNIKIKSEVDPELLAGFILEYGKSGSQRIDLSLRGQLEELREELQEGIRNVMKGGVPAGVQLMVAALGVNALLAGDASAKSGNIFDFGLTMPIQMIQFLLLMVFLEKVVFTPVGKVIDERAEYIRQKNAAGADNSKEIAALNAEAEALLAAARRDAAKELDKAKKEATAQGAERFAKAKSQLDASLKQSLVEVQRSKDELWAKLEQEVLPVLAEDIVNRLLEEEPAAAAASQ